MMTHSPTDPPPRWLNDDEMQTWLALVSMTIRLPAALDRQLRRDAGITHFDYQVLAVLSESADRSRKMKVLAGITESSFSRLSHCISRLEETGWVRRTFDPDDGRSTIATLTPTGMKKLAAAAPGHIAAVRQHVFDPLTERQIAQLRTIASRVVETTARGSD